MRIISPKNNKNRNTRIRSMRLPSRILFIPTLRTPRSYKDNKETLRIRIPDPQATIRS
jgi:hypothetical protein